VKLAVTLAACTAALSLAAAPGRAQSTREKWISVADRLVGSDPASYPFDWGEGVQMSGLMQAWERTRAERYAIFVEQWARHHQQRSSDELMGNQPGSKRRGFCGTWVCGTALLYLDEARPDPRNRRTADAIAHYIRAGATRSPEGLLAHWEGNSQLWVDTLAMACPLLARLARLEDKPAYLDDAVNQLLLSARRARDRRTGLFVHMWDWREERRSTELWARGNGWVILSLADVFEFLPRTHPRRRELQQLAFGYARDLVKAQNAAGVFHTLMDRTDSPEESSATCMIAYGLLKLARLGVLPSSFRAPALRAWEAVNARWIRDGLVTGVSGGTIPGAKNVYLDRPMGSFPWGTGAYLMAGAEADRLRARR
jgi:unsaturated rhamnogalacturonyl hydrolase